MPVSVMNADFTASISAEKAEDFKNNNNNNKFCLPRRVHGHALLQKLSLRPDFMKLWTHMVPERDRRPIEKFLKTENRPCPR